MRPRPLALAICLLALTGVYGAGVSTEAPNTDGDQKASNKASPYGVTCVASPVTIASSPKVRPAPELHSFDDSIVILQTTLGAVAMSCDPNKPRRAAGGIFVDDADCVAREGEQKETAYGTFAKPLIERFENFPGHKWKLREHRSSIHLPVVETRYSKPVDLRPESVPAIRMLEMWRAERRWDFAYYGSFSR